MSTVTVKGLWFHKLRYALTGLAIILGVAFMAGTMVLTDTMEQTFQGVFETANAGTDAIVRHAETVGGEGADVPRQRVDAALVDEVVGIDGVAAAHGSIVGMTQLVRADGTVTEGVMAATVGVNWVANEQLNPLSLATGREPDTAREAVIDQATADNQHWQLGDEFTVLTHGGPFTLTLVGTATFGDVEGVPGVSMVATNDATAQQLFAQPGRYDSVVVAADPGVSATELAARISSQLDEAEGAPLEVLTGEQDVADQQAELEQDLSFFSDFLMAFAYVSLFVGTFIIYNTFSIVVAQRTRDLAMLRAIGARRGQVLRSIVIEAAVVGIVAAAIGLAAGIGLSYGLRELLAAVGLDVPDGAVVISSATVTTAFIVGLTVSVLSAVVPAVRAGRVKPIAALRDVAVDRTGVSMGRVAAGLLLTAVGVVSFASGVTATGDAALPLLGLGAMTVILGVFTLGPVLVRPAVRALGAPATKLTGFTGRYARENAHRTPKRTTATASALMIGVALIGFITILASSSKASVGEAVDKSFRADYVIDAGTFDRVGFAPTIEQDVLAVDDVATLSPLRATFADIAGSSTEVIAVDTAVFDGLYDLDVTSGSLSEVEGDAVAVNADTAADNGLSLGDSVSVQFADGSEADLGVETIFDGGIAGTDANWIIDLDTFEAHVADQLDRQLFISLVDGADPDAARAAIADAVSPWPNAEIQDQADFKAAITDEIDRILNLIYGLLALAEIIALIGVANTMALSVYERTRELGLLRAVGMHRRQVRSAVRWESVFIAALGAVSGTLLAVAGSWGVIKALDDDGVATFALPISQLTITIVAAGLAGVGAATGPARRAAKLDILGAIAFE